MAEGSDHMKAASFVYERPGTRAEAVGFLQDGRARVLAGGQSLVPSLNMRLDAPERLVDINHVNDFSQIEYRDGQAH
jgi:carbon-monoxide dehydrogenase medium subunit